MFLAAALFLAAPPRVVVKIDPNRVLNVFDPAVALGGGVDGHEEGDVARIYTPENVREMLGAGLGSLTYRLRTELGVDAWHFVPEGKFSEGDHGYWTSDWASAKPVRESYGYSLPRRGNTTDEASNDGYSRLDDGNPDTFWKSNPYLDRYFTHEPDAMHPQWVVLDFGKSVRLNTIRIDWGWPSAKRFEVQVWQGPDELGPTDGVWKTVYRTDEGRRGPFDTTFHAASSRFLRLRLLESDRVVRDQVGLDIDVRDRVGFAINEIYAGWTDSQGKFQDFVRHGKGRNKQTLIYVSSTDPWHGAADRDSSIEQPGFDRVWESGLARKRPMLVPVPVLFGTPDEAANIVRYLKRRKIPIAGIEMGEEPDGQFVEPEDYGALYLQVADAIHRVDPKLRLGGPCFEEIQIDVINWPQPIDTQGWTKRFLDYLRQRKRLSDLSFLSFEWYPFDDMAGDTPGQLRRAPKLLEDSLKRLWGEGLPEQMPLFMTEYGYSAFAGQNEVDLPGAVLNADIVGKFLALGGDAAFLYGYEPSPLDRDGPKASWGNNTILVSDDERQIVGRTATYWGARLLTQSWCAPGGGSHRLLKTKSGDQRVTAYTVRRPDGSVAVLLLNKNPERTVSVKLEGLPAGPFAVDQFGPDQYEWKEDGRKSRPKRSNPPAHWTQPSGSLSLPPYSLTVMRLLGK